jgi:DNA-binding MurR/RpiR family transcriptional regulator
MKTINKKQLLVRIKNLVQSDDTTYQPIANFIFNNSRIIEKFNIAYLAKITNSSPATVTRFCKSIGLQGYKELTFILSEQNKLTTELVPTNLLVDSLKLKEQVNEIISETAYLIDDYDFNQLVNDLVTRPNKIMFLGYGESYTFLRMFASRLLRLGINIATFSQQEDLEVAMSLIDETNIILALSLSGTTKQVLEISRFAKQRKAKLYSITKYEMNELKKISDINFSISYDAEKLISKSPRYGIFFLLDLIFEKIVACNNSKYLPILKKTRKNK